MAQAEEDAELAEAEDYLGEVRQGKSSFSN
jgi:hypothetical protein